MLPADATIRTTASSSTPSAASRWPSVGGNAGAPATPVGFAYPGAVVAGTAAYNGDRPFGGTVTIDKNPGDMVGVDYIELERFDTGERDVGPAADGRRARLRPRVLGAGRDAADGLPGLPGAHPVRAIASGRPESGTRTRAASRGSRTPAGRAPGCRRTSACSPTSTPRSSPTGPYEFRAVGWQDDGSGGLTEPPGHAGLRVGRGEPLRPDLRQPGGHRDRPPGLAQLRQRPHVHARARHPHLRGADRRRARRAVRHGQGERAARDRLRRSPTRTATSRSIR